MKKIIDKWYAFTDKLFEEKANNIICVALLIVALALIAIQAIRGIGYILIAN
ncbi:hypothetical protein [Proteiniphilum acetatigenes]|uniref:hypothetical protein n=1 Tax=Proteiniphilum acetatigenes TaxID=294710 RepID=UPI000369478B|nr:hypothetical protein [Proteiniphilum acetatigenes]